METKRIAIRRLDGVDMICHITWNPGHIPMKINLEYYGVKIKYWKTSEHGFLYYKELE